MALFLGAQVFNLYLNTIPGQGARSVRTEDAIGTSLAFLQPAILLATGQLARPA